MTSQQDAIPARISKEISESKCPVCRGKYTSSGSSYVVYDGLYQIFKCANCGLSGTFPLPHIETINKFYGQDFNYDWYRNNLPNKLYDSKKRFIEYSEYLGKKCLDFGGGVGYFSSTCREMGLISETYDPYASRNVPDQKEWDSVVSLHVLEHMSNPHDGVLQMLQFLKPGGVLIISVPNAESSSYCKYGLSAVWAQPPILHLHHFTKESLMCLANTAGVEIARISTTDRWDANYLCDVVFRPLTIFLDRTYSYLDKFNLGRLHSFFVGGVYRRLGLWCSLRFFAKHADQEISLFIRKSISIPT